MISLFLVEDERIARESIRDNVPWQEHDILFLGDAPDGEVALPQLLEKRPDILLTDIKMPFMDGLELARIVRKELPDTRIIILSGHNEFEYARKAITLGVNDYLLKPVNPHQILLTLKKNIHVETIRSETAGSAYRREFMQIDSLISQTLDIEGWMSLYKKLVRWEFELSDAPEAMNEMLRSQWHDAEKAFAAFVARHYEGWVAASPGERPLLSPDVISRRVFPSLRAGRQVVLMVFDNLRFDQWRVLSEELSGEFDIDESLGLSILPTATGYARNAIFAGLMPAMIKKMYPGWRKKMKKAKTCTKKTCCVSNWPATVVAKPSPIAKSTTHRVQSDSLASFTPLPPRR